MATADENMEGIQTEESPTANYVIVAKPGTVFIEARIITHSEWDVQEVRSIGISFNCSLTQILRFRKLYKLDYPSQTILALSNGE